MKWAVDRIENNIALLENIITLEKKEVAVSLLPENIHEGSILFFTNNTYVVSLTEEEKRRKEIEFRFRRLRNKD